MSVGFIMYEIVDKDSHKYQGINTTQFEIKAADLLDIHLKVKVLTPVGVKYIEVTMLDIHLNIKVLTPLPRDGQGNPELDIHLNIKVLTP